MTATSTGVGLAGGGLLARPAAAATDDELAFANFGAATELLLRDFYGRAGTAKLFAGSLGKALARGRFAATEHGVALATLLTDAGQTAPLEDDFEFAWPAGTGCFSRVSPRASANSARRWRWRAAASPSATRSLQLSSWRPRARRSRASSADPSKGG